MLFHFPGALTEDYDFQINRSLYKILADKMDMKTALQTCQNELEGGGWVLSVESQSEMDDIATELVIRHEGTELEYWVFGNITDNFTLSQLTVPPQPGECLGSTYAYQNSNVSFLPQYNTLTYSLIDSCDQM